MNVLMANNVIITDCKCHYVNEGIYARRHRKSRCQTELANNVIITDCKCPYDNERIYARRHRKSRCQTELANK